jgi:hypothetical protein
MVLRSIRISPARSGEITNWRDQVGTNDAQATLREGPKLGALTIGGHRAIVFEGGSQVGAINWLGLPGSIAALDLKADAYTVIAVVQPSSSLPRNQAAALAPARNVLFSLYGQAGDVASMFGDGRERSVGWGIEAGAFNMTAVDVAIETSPVVVAFRSGPAGTTIRQNEIVRTLSERAGAGQTAQVGRIGGRYIAAGGPESEAWDGRIVALLIYKAAISDRQMDDVFQSLYQRVGLPPQRVANSMIWVGDSIAAGYKTPGLHGAEKRLQGLLANPVRSLNFAVAGQTASPQAPEAPYYAYLAGMFDSVVAPHIVRDRRRNVVIVAVGTNDLSMVPPPPVATVFAAIKSIVAKAKAAGANAVIVNTVLPVATGSYQQHIDALTSSFALAQGRRHTPWLTSPPIRYWERRTDQRSRCRCGLTMSIRPGRDISAGRNCWRRSSTVRWAGNDEAQHSQGRQTSLTSVAAPDRWNNRPSPEAPQQIRLIALAQQRPRIAPQTVPALIDHQTQALARSPVAKKTALAGAIVGTTKPSLGDQQMLGEIRGDRALAAMHGSRLVMHAHLRDVRIERRLRYLHHRGAQHEFAVAAFRKPGVEIADVRID